MNEEAAKSPRMADAIFALRNVVVIYHVSTIFIKFAVSQSALHRLRRHALSAQLGAREF